MESEDPAEVGQHCSEPTSCSALRVMLSPHPQVTTWRMAVHALKKQVKNLVCIRGGHPGEL